MTTQPKICPIIRLACLTTEYCAGPFYRGWWLFERDYNGHYRWLSGEIGQAEVEEMLTEAGYDPPPAKQHSHALAEWVAGAFPYGIHVRVSFGTPIYELIAIIRKRRRKARKP